MLQLGLFQLCDSGVADVFAEHFEKQVVRDVGIARNRQGFGKTFDLGGDVEIHRELQTGRLKVRADPKTRRRNERENRFNFRDQCDLATEIIDTLFLLSGRFAPGKRSFQITRSAT